MNIPTEVALEKIANELETYAEVINAENILTKMAFATKTLKLLKQDDNNFEKKAAISNSSIREVGGTLARALVAGIGLGLAGEAIGTAHEKVKKVIFNSKLNSLTKEIKKTNPELSHMKDEEIKKMLNAGYVLAPDIMQNPVLASSFVSIGKSLGGRIDPNTMKTFAETQEKSVNKRNNPFAEVLPNSGNVI